MTKKVELNAFVVKDWMDDTEKDIRKILKLIQKMEKRISSIEYQIAKPRGEIGVDKE